MISQNEYEVVSYPRLNHVMIGFTHLLHRNPHLHNELELCLVLSGEVTVHLQDKRFDVKTGGLMVFNSNVLHELSSCSFDGARIAFVQISNQFCQDYIRQLCDYEFLEEDISAHVTDAQNNQLVALVLQLIANYAQEGEISTLNCMANLFQLLSHLCSWLPCRRLEESDQRTKNRRSHRLRQITQYIEANYTRKITLQELSEKTGLTITYLSHFIRDNLGMTFQEYLNNIRFEKALVLMESTKMTLMDISLSSGFSDLKYMTKICLQRFGCLPKEYRKRLRTGNNARKEPKYTYQDVASDETGRQWIEGFEQQRDKLEKYEVNYNKIT